MLFDHHIHSKHSALDSVSEICDIIEVAKGLGLGGIAVSDHDTIEGSLQAAKSSSKEFLIVPSMEISSADGHIVGLGVRREVEPHLPARETVERIHAQGGLAIAAHPYDMLRQKVGDLCWKLDFDAVEINGHCIRGNGRAEEAAREHGIPLVGGSDAHSLGDIGSIVTEVEAGSEKELLGALKGGECRPIYIRGKARLKAEIVADRIARKCRQL